MEGAKGHMIPRLPKFCYKLPHERWARNGIFREGEFRKLNYMPSI